MERFFLCSIAVFFLNLTSYTFKLSAQEEQETPSPSPELWGNSAPNEDPQIDPLSEEQGTIENTDEIDANAPWYHLYQSGLEAIEKGLIQDAYVALEASIDQNPQQSVSYLLLGDLELDADNWRNALKNFNLSLKNMPVGNYRDEWNRAWIYFMLGRPHEAIESATLYAQQNPFHPYHNINIGLYLWTLGYEARAYDFYIWAFTLAPDSYDLYQTILNDLEKVQKLPFYLFRQDSYIELKKHLERLFYFRDQIT